jgi:hypothetical protein
MKLTTHLLSNMSPRRRAYLIKNREKLNKLQEKISVS